MGRTPNFRRAAAPYLCNLVLSSANGNVRSAPSPNVTARENAETDARIMNKILREKSFIVDFLF
jgi:hypothetical protein